jgi:CRISPR-associated protein Cas1
MSTSVSSTAGQSLDTAAESDTIRVNALHALNYCQRLYYLEEVEQLYTQDAAVFAGRRLKVYPVV